MGVSIGVGGVGYSCFECGKSGDDLVLGIMTFTRYALEHPGFNVCLCPICFNEFAEQINIRLSQMDKQVMEAP